MALTTARKKANAKYEAKAYDKTLVRLPKGRLDEIRAHIEPAGESLNGFIGRAINEAMARDGAGGPQEAAERTGEAPAVFVARAIAAQAKRDGNSLKLGINPVTGDKLKREA